MKFDTYVKRHKVNMTDLAKKIGVARWSLVRYRNGRVPESPIMLAIFKATGGKVKPNDWFPEVVGRG
jgi:DNA-binding XRE family transcriptional regulator